MNAIGMLVQQLDTVNLRLHHVARAVTPELVTAAAATSANPVGFLLWHMPRTQDWAVQTAIRGVPEVVFRPPWSEMPSIAVPGMGTGFSHDDAYQLARRIDVTQLLAYADAVHAEVVSWVGHLAESELDAVPDWAAHCEGRPEYHTEGFLSEMDSGPEHDQAVGDVGGHPVWLYLTSVCVTHLHRHLGELDLTLGVLTGRPG